MPASLLEPVHQPPRLLLSRWAAFEVRIPQLSVATVHLVGMRDAGRVARVTSPVAQVATDTSRARTVSGRIYDLVGDAGLSNEAATFWRQWLHHWDGVVLSDVTSTLTLLWTTGRRPNFQDAGNWQPFGGLCPNGSEMPLLSAVAEEAMRVH